MGFCARTSAFSSSSANCGAAGTRACVEFLVLERMNVVQVEEEDRCSQRGTVPACGRAYVYVNRMQTEFYSNSTARQTHAQNLNPKP